MAKHMRNQATVLLVDDEPDFLTGLTETLEGEGYNVLATRDGVEALGILRRQVVELILADVAMPRMNGYQLYQRVTRDPNWRAIPFVFLSSRNLDSDVRYGVEMGANAYLTKPIDLDALLATVTRLLDPSHLHRPAAAPAPSPVDSGAHVWSIGRLQIAPGQYRTWLDGNQIELSAREFTLLLCLAEHAGTVVRLQDLVQRTHDLEVTSAQAGTLLRPIVRSLRRKLGYPTGDVGCIKSVRGVGYLLVPPEGQQDDEY
jgi:DNA-binding response OmpR family regulator